MIAMLKSASPAALRTFIGTALIKIATGTIGIWGNTNIYYFSYLHHHGTSITKSTNSILLLCAVIPSSLAMLLSTTLSKRFGYQRVIRICAILWALFPLIINLQLSLFTLGLCFLFIPVSCFSISSVPVLNCLWSQFPKDLNKVSGAAVLFFAVGAILWNLIFVAIVNPDNVQAVIDEQKQAFFPPEVADRVFMASNVVMLSGAVCFITGSWMVEKRQGNVQEQKRQLNQSPNSTQEQKTPSDDVLSASQADQQPKQTLKNVLRDRKFIILFLISFLTPLYLIYLVLYMKLIFMPIINDDHYMAFCSVVLTVSAICGGPFWGHIGDKLGFKKTLIVVLVCDIFFKFLGLFCTEKYNLFLLYFFLGFNDKGVLTIIGPGLIDIFGLEMATELIPYKGISVFLAYIMVPVVQLVASSYLPYTTILLFFIACTAIAVALGYYFYKKFSYVPHGMKGQRKSPDEQIQMAMP